MGRSEVCPILLVLLSNLGVTLACARIAERNSDSRQQSLDPLAARQEVVAQADRLAAQAERESVADAVRSLSQAAHLRERLWRLEGKGADGLEAIEYLAELGRRGSCFSDISSKTLRAEVEDKPEFAVQALAELMRNERDPDCQKWGKRILAVYAAGSEISLAVASTEDMSRAVNSRESAQTDLIVPALSRGSLRGLRQFNAMGPKILRALLSV